MRDPRSQNAVAYRRLYKAKRWELVRKAQLSKQPECEWCLAQGIHRDATVVHHKHAKSKLDADGFFAGPFVSLCKHCHDNEGHHADAVGYLKAVGADGLPLDASHPWR